MKFHFNSKASIDLLLQSIDQPAAFQIVGTKWETAISQNNDGWIVDSQYQIHNNGILMLGLITKTHITEYWTKNIFFFVLRGESFRARRTLYSLKKPDMHWLIEFNISGHFLCCSCSCNHFLQSSDLLPSAVLCTSRTEWWSPNNLFAKKLSDYEFYLCSKLNLITQNHI